MTNLLAKILIFLIILLFGFFFTTARPVSGGGKLSFKLCIANAIGWLIVLPLSAKGHPPPLLIPAVLIWLINLVLLPAAAFALWSSYKERDESHRYLAIASTYVALNVMVLFAVPLIWLVSELYTSK